MNQPQQPSQQPADRPLAGRIALVAGATRGAGRAMAVELGRGGATVYVTGRTTREHVSEVGRPTETIEQTAELIDAAGGHGIAVPTDHLQPEQVRALTERIDREQGRLDILVNDIWGGDHLLGETFNVKLWDVGLETGLRMLRLGVETHLVTSHFALPLLIRNPGGLVVEVTDGTAEYNGANYRDHMYYDLAKNAPLRMAFGLSRELREYGATAVCVTPGFLRSEQMLDTFGVREENWRDAIAKEEHFGISETPLLLGRGVAALAADPERARWNGRSLASYDLGREYGVRDADGSLPDPWRYFAEVVMGDKPGSVDDYR
ncbi:SDR family oxidoreductase [Streptomyces aidingensis]|uniref:NAD(P)-dependent dehydrogenase, short-chain alcohol dehydrogenase family n=1 Tax=Streptomyces aidingensis TaxID=910347 RepID=A0A1I1LDX8_9ACTN|nr:SDR family oxidoreductase [Streptomyces aidingensis]SFC71294.1 NAD(P)-dependent dehydrogenase, short-chain alcohol dehydrogenase family [Streptomyces aidingensis]